MDLIDEIRRVIDIEIESLQAVRDGISKDFEHAVKLIAACDGQVLLTGIGKSGLIAQKIAATLRSTGTPAVFIHASDALHGDLGLARSGDLILAVGKSGESDELNELLRAFGSTDLTIIAMTSSPDSSMTKLSDVVLNLKIVREACPLNLAPTSSTTAALVVGDAIAVTLMKLKGISADDFARHHPGGQLGKRLTLRVDAVMRSGDENPTISSDATASEMLVAMTRYKVGALSVVGDDGELLGLITDYDIRVALERGSGLSDLGPKAVMNRSPRTIRSDEMAVDALATMKSMNKPTAVIPVVDDGDRVVGMVHLHDLLGRGL